MSCTLRAGAEGTSKTSDRLSTTIEKERCFPPIGRLLTEYAFCQALYKGIEGEDWEEI